jgi:hypothetical protein
MTDQDKNFNFDDFQRELSQAESYLRCSISKDNKNIVTEEDKRFSIEAARKHDILQQLGRKPLGNYQIDLSCHLSISYLYIILISVSN